ncbi:hypothetical protein [Erythrobacter sp. SD-21]|uniref:hypothetical protein n=1 Tax=Erythrobacter sp. SD-21 TaxID=161528 RepID=UPI000153FA78|nr:hypothetical protein [Erythrobacter sp. SD-21]EDL48618.1 hypothetical protein ED21_30474 [Erythrobacter sp. SD-21]
MEARKLRCFTGKRRQGVEQKRGLISDQREVDRFRRHLARIIGDIYAADAESFGYAF